LGLAYSLPPGLIPGAKGAALTLGYRNQVLATQQFRVAINDTVSRSTDLRDTTEGMTVGLSVSF
jgi:hypothetical protein